MLIVRNLMLAAVLAAPIGLVAVATGAPDHPCTEIIRFDERNARLFVICLSLPDMSVEEIRVLVAEIFAGFKGPSDEYFVSFFSTEELAGYKDEECCEASLASGAWRNAYLGEYYTHSHRLTLWPALSGKRREVQL